MINANIFLSLQFSFQYSFLANKSRRLDIAFWLGRGERYLISSPVALVGRLAESSRH